MLLSMHRLCNFAAAVATTVHLHNFHIGGLSKISDLMVQLRIALSITCRLTDLIANDHHERKKDADEGDKRCQVRINVMRGNIGHVKIDVDDKLFVFKPMCWRLLTREICELEKDCSQTDEKQRLVHGLNCWC